MLTIPAIKQSDVDDVREVLRYYKQYDDPIEAFRENQRKLQVLKFKKNDPFTLVPPQAVLSR